MVWFIIGAFVGGVFGFLLCAILTVASVADDRLEHYYDHEGNDY